MNVYKINTGSGDYQNHCVVAENYEEAEKTFHEEYTGEIKSIELWSSYVQISDKVLNRAQSYKPVDNTSQNKFHIIGEESVEKTDNVHLVFILVDKIREAHDRSDIFKDRIDYLEKQVEELKADNQMNKLEKDLESGKITPQQFANYKTFGIDNKGAMVNVVSEKPEDDGGFTLEKLCGKLHRLGFDATYSRRRFGGSDLTLGVTEGNQDIIYNTLWLAIRDLEELR